MHPRVAAARPHPRSGSAPRTSPPVGALAVLALAALATVLAACTGAAPDPTDTTTLAPTDTTLAPGPTSPPVPPDVADAASTAERWLAPPGGYREVEDVGTFELDALTAISLWLPTELAAGSASNHVTDGDAIVSVVSVIPIMTWRADPGLVPALASLGREAGVREAAPNVFTTTTDAGLDVALWSTGDGFLVASSLTPGAAVDYLAEREADRRPLPVWSSGDCLYFAPGEDLPWAPVALDRVVPCDGPHTAEVLLGVGDAGIASYDDDAIALRRNYECDRAYDGTFGPQRDHTPSLVTYMPDADEYARGDRYLACVVERLTNEGPALLGGPLAAEGDLAWSPSVGMCFGPSLAPEGVDCADAHTYEFIGEVEADTLDAWTADPAVLVPLCAPLVDALAGGPAVIDVFPMGLYPYAFEQGERSIRCMAFARGEDEILDVSGSFTGQWRVVDVHGIPA